MKNFTILLLTMFVSFLHLNAQTQMNLPVTFDEANVNYGVLGFEGAENSEIVEDPTDATNNVVRVIRSNTAATFAGTTVTDVVNGI